MDGVITQTATIHAEAWKQLFDEILKNKEGDKFKPFDKEADYKQYVDGLPRYDGIKTFLASRGIISVVDNLRCNFPFCAFRRIIPQELLWKKALLKMVQTKKQFVD